MIAVRRHQSPAAPDHATLAFSGVLDVGVNSTSCDVRSMLPDGAGGSVTIDVGAVTYADSSGISFLLMLRRRADELGLIMDVVNPSPALVRSLRITGLLDHLNVRVEGPLAAEVRSDTAA